MAPILFEKERMHLILHYVVPKILKKVKHPPRTLIIKILPCFYMQVKPQGGEHSKNKGPKMKQLLSLPLHWECPLYKGFTHHKIKHKLYYEVM
jgi:hypothetical protein